jgi:hypothetical protein
MDSSMALAESVTIAYITAYFAPLTVTKTANKLERLTRASLFSLNDWSILLHYALG